MSPRLGAPTRRPQACGEYTIILNPLNYKFYMQMKNYTSLCFADAARGKWLRRPGLLASAAADKGRGGDQPVVGVTMLSMQNEFVVNVADEIEKGEESGVRLILVDAERSALKQNTTGRELYSPES